MRVCTAAAGLSPSLETGVAGIRHIAHPHSRSGVRPAVEGVLHHLRNRPADLVDRALFLDTGSLGTAVSSLVSHRQTIRDDVGRAVALWTPDVQGDPLPADLHARLEEILQRGWHRATFRIPLLIVLLPWAVLYGIFASALPYWAWVVILAAASPLGLWVGRLMHGWNIRGEIRQRLLAEFRCASCGAELRMAPSARGELITCPDCCASWRLPVTRMVGWRRLLP